MAKQNKPKPSGYIDITKQYGIPQFTEEYINKAMELNKQYPGSKFVCTANGCADIASQAANAMGHDFGKANAWEYGNRSDVLFTNPNYAKELENPNGPLHDPTSYNVPNQFLGMENVLVGLNRKNNLLDVQGNKVGNIPNAQQVGAAKTRKEANDSLDYANQNLYKGSRGYEHVGYMMGNNTLLHGTGASKDHPAFFVLDDISNGIDLSGYGQYEPVEAIAEPTKLQTFTNKVRSLGTRAGEMVFGEPGSKQASSNIIKKENGGWLDKYQEGGVAKTDATRVAAPALKLTKAQLEKNKAINKQVMVNTEKANAKILAERKKGIAESSEADIINPNDKRFAIGDKFRMFPNDVGGVGEMFDDFINPAVFVGNTASGLGNAMIDRDAEALTTEAGLALGTGALGFDPLGGAMKAIPNTYKINPWAYKPAEGMMFRGLGEEGYQDALQSGVFRSKQNVEPSMIGGLNMAKSFGTNPYFTPKFKTAESYGSKYLAEVPESAANWRQRYKRTDWSQVADRPIPINEGRILQKDWLQGYKPIKEDGGWLEKYNDGGPVQPNYNDYSVSAGPGFQGDGYSNVGRNYSPAWGGQFQMGGSLPGATGFMYARVGAPSNGKYAKKTKASAQNGAEMRYYQEGFDFNPKSISEDGSKNSKLSNQEMIKKLGLKPVQTVNPIEQENLYAPKANPINGNGTLKDLYNFEKDMFKRGLEVVANPISALSALNRHGRLPRNFSKGEFSPFDLATSWFNPAARIESGINTYDSAKNVLSGKGGFGDYADLVLNASSLKNVGKAAGKEIKKIKETIDRNKQQKLLPNRDAADWMKNMYSDPVIKQRIIDNTPDVFTKGYTDYSYNNETGEVISNVIPDRFKAERLFWNDPVTNPIGNKNYNDLYKEKGLKEWMDLYKTSSGVSYGKPEEIYVKNNLFDKVERESVRVHEATHAMENNGWAFFEKEEDKLLKPFNLTQEEYYALPPDKGYAKKYYTKPTEIHARMNESRYKLGHTPGQEYTMDDFNKSMKMDNMDGMGRYIEDPKAFVDLMNTFYQAAPVLGAGALGAAAIANEPKKKNGGPIKDDRGQWDHPGEITEIGSNQITMQGVPYPVLGISDTGDMQMMYPDEEYEYDGESVTEYPMAQDGRQVAYVDSVLNANKDLNWVKRLYDVNRKSMMLPGQKDPSTHFMESGDGRVYPTVVEMPNGKLKHLGDKAYDYADSTNTFIQFPDDSAAQWFGKNYKQGTGVLKKKKQGGQLTKLDQLTNFTNYNTKQPGGWLDKYQ